MMTQSALGHKDAPTCTTFCQDSTELSALGNEGFPLTFGCSADFQLKSMLHLELVTLSTCSQPFSPSLCSVAWDCLGLASRRYPQEAKGQGGGISSHNSHTAQAGSELRSDSPVCRAWLYPEQPGVDSGLSSGLPDS